VPKGPKAATILVSALLKQPAVGSKTVSKRVSDIFCKDFRKTRNSYFSLQTKVTSKAICQLNISNYSQIGIAGQCTSAFYEALK